MTAPEHEIGLVPIGRVSLQETRQLLDLHESQLLVHSLLGGRVEQEQRTDWQAVQEVYDLTITSDELEEIEL